MRHTKKTKRALIISLVSLVLSFALLVGTTFAWFTDSVTNTGNVITAGNLSIDAIAYDLDMTSGDKAYTIPGINNGEEIRFETTGQDLKDPDCSEIISETLWEPGKSNAKLLEVKNSGDLAANIRLSFALTDGGLMDALWFDFIMVGDNGQIVGSFDPKPMSSINQVAAATTVPLKGGESAKFILVYGMNETAGNTYKNTSFSADVTIMATQATVEADGFGNTQYDAAANGEPDQSWTPGGTTTVAVVAGQDTVLSVPGATVTVPDGTASSSNLKLEVVPTEKPAGVTVESYEGAQSYDIEVTGLNSGSTASIEVKLFVGKDLSGVKVYHNSDEVDGATYDATTGYVTFTTTSFSPFTVVWDKTVGVTTEAELKAALEAGGFVRLDADIAIVPTGPDAGVLFPQITVTKDTVLNLNGKTLGVAEVTESLPYSPALIAVNSGTLTINGNGGTITAEAGYNTCYGVNVNGGSVVINGGYYYGAMTTIQVQKGSLIINDGFFDLAPTIKADAPQYATYIVNCIDKAFKDGTARIYTRGGTFVNFDPSDKPENSELTYVEADYKAVPEAQENGETWYNIVPVE